MAVSMHIDDSNVCDSCPEQKQQTIRQCMLGVTIKVMLAFLDLNGFPHNGFTWTQVSKKSEIGGPSIRTIYMEVTNMEVIKNVTRNDKGGTNVCER